MKAMGKGSLSSLLTTLINIAWHVSRVLLALSLCLLCLAPWVDPPQVEVGFEVPAAFQLDRSTHPITATENDLENVHLEGTAGVIRFSPRNRVVVAALAVFMIVVFGLVIWVLGQLRALFSTLRAGRPFVAANAARIRRIGYAMIVAEVAKSLSAYAGMRYAMANFSMAGVRFEARPDLDVLALISGLIILVIAEVFREGTRLADEQSLTI